jgi:hypothetical protein
MTINLFITLWTLGGFTVGVIVGAIFGFTFSYSTGRVAIIKIEK